ncbi:hypothetical protein BJV78DRAFT_1156633 [Lactifluus subvellereus]|nr:hypothetical protein BJV78DRAFT_1156633 [Lactifluus subvellereus]
MQHDYHAPQMTHNHNTFQKPPGGEITEPPTSTESLPQANIHIEEHASSQLLSSLSVNTLSDISEASPHAPSTPSAIPPPPLCTYNLRAPEPTLRGGSGPVDAGPYVGVPQQAPAFSGLSPTIAQPTAPPAFFNADTPMFLSALHQTPVLAPSGVTTGRRFSEADALRMADTQNATQSLHAVGYRPTPPTFLPLPEQLSYFPVPSSAQSFSAGFTDATPVPLSQPQGGPLAPMDVDLLSTSSTLQWDLANVEAYPGPPLAIGPGAPSQTADCQFPQYGASPTSPQLERTEHGRIRNPKDRPSKYQKATNRLKSQRKSDNENIEALCRLFVPKDAEVRWKKDRLGTNYATEAMQMHGHVAQGATSIQRNVLARSDRWLKVEGGNSENQGRLLHENDDFLRLGDYFEASEMGVARPLEEVGSSVQQQPHEIQCTINAMWPDAT